MRKDIQPFPKATIMQRTKTYLCINVGHKEHLQNEVFQDGWKLHASERLPNGKYLVTFIRHS